MWMGLWPNEAIYIPWDVWAVTWVAAAFWTGRTVKREWLAGELPYRILTLSGFMLLLAPALTFEAGHVAIVNWPGVLGEQFWVPPVALGWAGIGFATMGFLFAWWARIYLGRLWSGAITQKEGHRVVDTGPYRIVRHPIYTGIIGAAIATVATTGTLHAILGAASLTLGYWLKARLEEQFLRKELGADAYDTYRRKVPMLLPFGPKSA